MTIASSDNTKIKLLRSLINQKKARKQHRLFIVEGATLFRETPSCYIQEAFVRAGDTELLTLAHTKCDKVYEVDERIFDTLSDTVTPAGIMAIVSQNVEKCSLGNSMLLLDGVKDPGNVGTLIRTAAGFKTDNVILVDSAEAYSPKVVRSAMGALFKTTVIEVSREEALNMLTDREVFVLDMGGVDIREVAPQDNYVIVVGNEAHGISKEFRDRANVVIAIKADGIESLNAAVAGSIAMYHFTK